jgi:hypothetical protein
MKESFAAIRHDFCNLVAVWELKEGCWELLKITRLKQAIALYRQAPSSRLVFPTGVSPNGMWGGLCRKRRYKKKRKQESSLAAKIPRIAATKVYLVDAHTR